MTDVSDRPSEATPPRQVRVVDAPLSPPAPRAGLLGVFGRRYLLRLLVRREVSARYQGSLLGMMWSYINPLSQFFIYYFVMGVLFGQADRIENFAVHIFSGLIIVSFFNETFNAGTRSIVRNKSLVQKMAVPREMFPVASMLVSFYHVVPELVILLVVSLILGWVPTLSGLAALVLSLMIIGTLGTALALFFSAANVFFRDVGNIVSILTNFVRFGVPMMYPFSLVHEKFGDLAAYYLFNPIANAVLLLDRAFWLQTTSNPAAAVHREMPHHQFAWGLYSVALSLVVLLIGQLVFARLENKIPERLS